MKNRIKDLRKRRRITQSDLGTELGISQQVVSRIENDPDSLTLEQAVRLASYFKVSIDYLLCQGDSGQAQSYGRQFDSLIGNIKNFDADDMTMLWELVRFINVKNNNSDGQE